MTIWSFASASARLNISKGLQTPQEILKAFQKDELCLILLCGDEGDDEVAARCFLVVEPCGLSAERVGSMIVYGKLNENEEEPLTFTVRQICLD